MKIIKLFFIFIIIYFILSFFINITTSTFIFGLLKDFLYYLSSILLIIVIVKKEKTNFSLFKIFSKNILKEFLLGIAIFLILSLFTLIPYFISQNPDILAIPPPTKTSLFLLVIFSLFIVAPIEEFIFRGYFFENFKLLLHNTFISNIIASILFGLIHYPGQKSFEAIIIPTIISFIFIILKEKFKYCTLFSLSIAHGLNNSFIMIMSYIIYLQN